MKKLSWEEVEDIMTKLSKRIKREFEPDFLLGVVKGGLIPLFFLSKRLDVENVYTISPEHIGKGFTSEGVFNQNLKNKRILIVDEIAESGNSLKKVQDFVVEKFIGCEIKSVTLAIDKNKCRFFPDFYEIVQEDDWVVFPWENDESWVKKGLGYSKE